MDMPDTNIEALAVTANPMAAARMKKINPKGRKLDKRGNPIVTKEELEASGMSLRDFLNKERGLTRRKESAPSNVRMRTPSDADISRARSETAKAKAASAPPNVSMRTPSDDDIKRAKAMTAKAMTAKALEEKYGSGLKMGGMVKKGRDGIAQRGKTKGRMC
jgi:hypothetical protein